MSYLTYVEILEKVQGPLDLQDEVFIGQAEMIGYCNDAIKRCESQIHQIYEDYFVTEAPLTLVTGESDIDIPTDIYANKIRAIIYNDGSNNCYEIKRIKDLNKFLSVEYGKADISSSSFYQYWIKNSSPAQDGRKIMLTPASKESAANKVVVYYLRRANKVVATTDLVDIPEFYTVIVAYMRYKAYLKEGHPNTAEAKEEYLAEEANMVETLTGMVPDGDTELPLPHDPYNGGI